MAYVLIIDDDEDFANAVEMVVSSSGHEVKVCHQIEAGEKLLGEATPDLLILDVMFPEDNTAGFTLARKIRHDMKNLAKMPILMLTAINQSFPLGFNDDDIDGEWLPVNDFIEKPVDLDVLKERVEKILSN